MVDTAPHIRRGHPIIFGLLCFFAIIEGAISTWLVTMYNRHNDYPSGSIRDRTRLIVFTSWWTVLFTLLYIVAFLRAENNIFASIASHVIWLFFTWVLWTASAASITHALGGGQRCSVSTLTHCSQLVAAEAFAWIEWILITVAFIVVILLAVRGIRGGDRISGPLVV